MGTVMRKWLIRVVVALIVSFMVISLGASFFAARNNQNNPNNQQQQESKYTYVDEKNPFELTGIGQTLLIPKGMKLESTTNSEENNAIIYRYNGVNYEDAGFSAGMVIMEMDAEKGADYSNEVLFNINEAAEQYRRAEFENINYLTFKGEEHDYLMALQTIYDNNPNYGYEIDYTIVDELNSRQYVISLFMLDPKEPSKTDMLKLDRLGKEVLSQTKYISAPIVDEFCLPEGNEDRFNHILG